MVLNYKQFGEGFPLIILHGILGSLDNWQSIAKKLAEPGTMPDGKQLAVYIIDQRNHGKSPHSDEFNYDLLVQDLLEFMEQHGIEQANLLGHSMGGKVVMKFALNNPDKVRKLIVADIGLGKYDNGNRKVFDALLSIDLKNISNRKEVELALRDKLANDEATIFFLMKGLDRDENNQQLSWKFNLASLAKYYAQISGEIVSNEPFLGPCLFIKGENSGYLNATERSNLSSLFPNYEFVEIKGAGHWVHADKPAEFLEVVKGFLISKQ